MSERPSDIQNWQIRQYDQFSPWFTIDTGNPQMGCDGTTVYGFYGYSPYGDKNVIRMSSTGVLNIYNDQRVEIIAGQNPENADVDIIITGKNGDIWITAEKDGQVKIKGKNITLEADKDINLTAGNTIFLKAENGIGLKSMWMHRWRAWIGNLAPHKGWKGIINRGNWLKVKEPDLGPGI